MKHIELVIFDLDGTLIDSGTDLVNSMSLLLEQREYPRQSPEILRNNIGWGVRRFVKRSCPPMTEEELDGAVADFRKIYWVHMLDTTNVFAGIPQMLNEISDKKLAVFTNKADDFTVSLLEKLGLAGYFHWVIGRNGVTKPKPDPEGVLTLMKLSGASRENVLYVGDSELDIICGKQAGVLTCGVTYGGILPVERLLEEAPDLVAHSPLEIVELIRKHEGN